MKESIFKDLESNIISWYEFKENSKILFCGEKSNYAFKFLKDKYKNVELYEKEKNDIYDYIVVLDSAVNEKQILKISKMLKEDGIILLAFDNTFGISKFITYKYNERISPLEEINENQTSLSLIKDILYKNDYKYINVYMPFPNWKRTDLILSEKLEDLSDKLEKYFLDYDENDIIIAKEINLLRNIADFDKELFIKLSNSYLLEISKNTINTKVKYVSFNNYRKDEYRLITIIKDEIVEKKPATEQATKNIKRIAKNLQTLNNYEFEILDKFEDNKLYSKYIKDLKTLDTIFVENYDNEEYIISNLTKIKDILLKNSVKYNKKYNIELCNTLKKQSEEVLNEFNYLEYAFYDMVPKNCFLMENKYCFFDQEWMEKYLPVEFIIYRSVINSYDLVKKIDVNKLLEKLNIEKYREIFEKIDAELRKKILDEEIFKELNKNYKKMYEVVYENEVLRMQNEQLKINDNKQNEYIKTLENKINKQ